MAGELRPQAPHPAHHTLMRVLRPTSPTRGITSSNGAPGRRGGTRGAGVGASVEFRVGSSVGVNRLGHGGTGPGPPGLRSLPAEQHAPKARPLPATDRGRRGRVSGGPLAPTAPPLPWRAWWPVRRGGHPTIVVVNRSQGDRRHRLVVAPVA